MEILDEGIFRQEVLVFWVGLCLTQISLSFFNHKCLDPIDEFMMLDNFVDSEIREFRRR
jgi:hypothetical protein